jgi:hypothetical protein
MAKKKTPPELLKEAQPVIVKLARELKITRYSTYCLIDPATYPIAPPGLFDVRSGLAERVATLIGWPVDKLRQFYAGK